MSQCRLTGRLDTAHVCLNPVPMQVPNIAAEYMVPASSMRALSLSCYQCVVDAHLYTRSLCFRVWIVFGRVCKHNGTDQHFKGDEIEFCLICLLC